MPAAERSVRVSVKKLRIVSFNIFYALRRKRLLKTVIDSFSQLNPDIVCLQEVFEGKKRNFAQSLAHSLGYHMAFSPRAGALERRIGLAILSRAPLTEVTSAMLPYSRSRRRPRILQLAALAAGGAEWHMANTHLDSTGGLETRRAQLAAVVQALSAHAGDVPTVLTGDFNTKTKQEVEEFRRTLDAAKFHVPDALPHSWRMLGARKRLDWICAKNCDIIASGVLENVKGSDHKPIWADIQHCVRK